MKTTAFNRFAFQTSWAEEVLREQLNDKRNRRVQRLIISERRSVVRFSKRALSAIIVGSYVRSVTSGGESIASLKL